MLQLVVCVFFLLKSMKLPHEIPAAWGGTLPMEHYRKSLTHVTMNDDEKLRGIGNMLGDARLHLAKLASGDSDALVSHVDSPASAINKVGVLLRAFHVMHSDARVSEAQVSIARSFLRSHPLFSSAVRAAQRSLRLDLRSESELDSLGLSLDLNDGENSSATDPADQAPTDLLPAIPLLVQTLRAVGEVTSEEIQLAADSVVSWAIRWVDSARAMQVCYGGVACHCLLACSFGSCTKFQRLPLLTVVFSTLHVWLLVEQFDSRRCCFSVVPRLASP
jgi:hypothetical protein